MKQIYCQGEFSFGTSVINFQNSASLSSTINTLSFIDIFLCKSLQYLFNFLPSASGWILVYASFLRFITIKRATKIQILESFWFNIGIISFIIIANGVLYAPLFIYNGMMPNYDNSSITSYYCYFINAEANNIIDLVFLIVAIILPFILMICISSCLIYFVIFTKKKFITQLSHNEAKKFRRDLKLAASVIGLDVMFFLTQIPITILSEIVNYSYILIL